MMKADFNSNIDGKGKKWMKLSLMGFRFHNDHESRILI